MNQLEQYYLLRDTLKKEINDREEEKKPFQIMLHEIERKIYHLNEDADKYLYDTIRYHKIPDDAHKPSMELEGKILTFRSELAKVWSEGELLTKYDEHFGIKIDRHGNKGRE